MEYDDIVKTLKEGRALGLHNVTGEQCFMLIRDGYIEKIDMDNNIYECNIIPYNTFSVKYIYINKITCPDFKSMFDILRKIIKEYGLGEPGYIVIEDNIFQIVIDVLETGG